MYAQVSGVVLIPVGGVGAVGNRLLLGILNT